jgi:hypothetical protein
VHVRYKQRIRLIGEPFQNQKVAHFSGYAKPAIVCGYRNQPVAQILNPYAVQGYPGFIFKYTAAKNRLRM